MGYRQTVMNEQKSEVQLGASSSLSFYRDLPAVSQLSVVSDTSMFTPAPPDWFIVIADIVDSTAAVSSGNYKEVNMAAGCIVAAVLNVTSSRGTPFVFGGDGASMLVPELHLDVTKQALIRTKRLISREFGLEMRVGLVPVSEIHEQKLEVLVARLELSEGNNIALFRGGGIEYAEGLVKHPQSGKNFLLQDSSTLGPPNIEGLSCRWEPLTSRHGAMLCILVSLRESTLEEQSITLNLVLDTVAQIVGGSLRHCSPVSEDNMHFRWPPRGLVMEAKVTRGQKSFARRYLEILISSFVQLILERFDLRGGNYNAPVYREELRTNSDYCRVDDSLRMILDCTTTQIKQIESALAALHERGKIDYGTFQTEEALMTCLVDDLSSHRHLHFIDGSNGGFWSAAKDLKSRRHNV